MFKPDYNNILLAATNKKPNRMPLYEHNISEKIMEGIMNKKFAELRNGDYSDKKEFFKHYCGFFKEMGYDTVSLEFPLVPILPGGGCLTKHITPAIKNREDFNAYPWDSIRDIYFERYDMDFDAVRDNVPDGMKLIGGIGYGLFEMVQDLTGYENLCVMSFDDPELYADIFIKCAEVYKNIWNKFLKKNSDIYAVCRFGDDLGFCSATLLSHDDIKMHIIPRYKEIVEIIHSSNKPFLLHSCGKIFDIMEDLIETVKIDAKHSNEDSIAPFEEWIRLYGDRIGNFGGIDTDVLCSVNKTNVKDYVERVYKAMNAKNGGVAIGSGNSIPDYVDIDKYVEMVETVRRLRGD